MGRTVAVAVEHFQPIAGPDRVESGLGVAQVPQIGTGLRFAADGSVASASLLLLLLLLPLLPRLQLQQTLFQLLDVLLLAPQQRF